MRDRLTGFLRQAADAIRATTRSKRRDERVRPTARGRDRTPPTPRPPAPAPDRSAPLIVGGVSVEYTPRLDGDPDPGEIVWAWVSYEEDPNQGKDRPVVVIGRRGTGLFGVPLTSKRDDRDPQVPVGTGPWDRERRPSYAKLDRIVPLDARSVRREGAILDRKRFDAIVDGLRRLHAGDG